MTGSEPFLEPPAQVLEVLFRLSRAGHDAFIVGGALRDIILGRPAQDWDVATSASPSQVSALFPRVIPTGARHGTVTVRLDGQNIEVTSFKGASILEDLSHRDFTLDAMAYDPRSNSLLDPHKGKQDAQERLLRAVGEASERMAEDPLRALRGIRLAAELELTLDPQLFCAIREAAPWLRRVAPERIRQELERILLVQKTLGALKLLGESGLMKEILPELGQAGSLSHISWCLEAVGLLPGQAALRWAALLLGVEKDFSPLLRQGPQESLASKAGEVLSRLRVSRRQAEHTLRTIYHHAVCYKFPWDEAAVRGLILQAGVPVARDAILLRKASLQAVGAPPEALSCLEELLQKLLAILSDPEALKKMQPVLRGTEVMELLGLTPGPVVGKILAQMQQAVILEPELNQKQTLIKWLLEKTGSFPKADSK